MDTEEGEIEENCSDSHPHVPAILQEKADRVRCKECNVLSRYCCIGCSKLAGKKVCLCLPQANVQYGYSNSCWAKWHNGGQ